MRVSIFPLGILSTNSYLIDNGKEAIAIDLGGDPAPMIDFLREQKLELKAILITHMHFDHLYGVHTLQKAFPVPTYVPAGDAPIANTEASLGGIWGMPLVPAFMSQSLSGTEIQIGDFQITIIPTPGHTPGGLSFYFKDDKRVFTGDALFYHSLGRTDFPGGSHEQLILSIRKGLFSLPDETQVYPGHGPETSIGEERINNPFIGDFAEEEN